VGRYRYLKKMNRLLDIKHTQKGIFFVKNFFEKTFAAKLNLQEVDAPLIVKNESGLNDGLNGVERIVSFDVKDVPGKFEVVQSLAKWKRYALQKYEFQPGEGLYTNMVAIRRDEDLSYMHSLTVRQVDWELSIMKDVRTLEYLQFIVLQIYDVLKKTEEKVLNEYTQLQFCGQTHWGRLPDSIYFVTTQELEDKYPDLSSKDREHAIAHQKGAVFIMKIGKKLISGQRHDGRAFDYDDHELNGDIVVWNPILNRSFEISSMGIRVDKHSLLKQAIDLGKEKLLESPYHQAILNETLPFSIGGGIGQSRLYMYFLRKMHVGEVNASYWPELHTNEYTSFGAKFL